MAHTYTSPQRPAPWQHHREQKKYAKIRGEIIHPHDINKRNGIVSWRIFRVMSELVDGYEMLSGLSREVTIFGSARTKPGSRYYNEAEKLGRMLAKEHYTVLTGGGPGIMEAANKGVFTAGGQSIGLNIQLPHEQRSNPYVRRGLGFHFFFTRKVMLTSPSQAFVFFPGGFGTLDEFFEVITLVQTQKMPRVPVILFGEEYWSALDVFLRQEVLEHHEAVEIKDLDLYSIVDNADQAMRIIRKTKESDYL
ncbi:MAG: TIGR00730 family Rossman fold protein [Candidatus Kerfeldbacteria bacterium]|nr:TIGR00730 family Rossman fold protein [Candidatus Kerfeldbacteria bacterium]